MDIRNPLPGAYAKTRDLGWIERPVLVCGGAYSNLEALTALLQTAREMGIPGSRIIHTGDAVAYCANPAETAALLRDCGAHSIQGNVEQSLSASLPDCGCGFDEDSLCDRLASEWFAFADFRIGDEVRRWMGALPGHLTFDMSGRRIRVVHGSVSSINRFMFASLPDAEFEKEFAAANADMILAGHSGIPFTRRVGERIWHNSGPLGLPANDGTPRVWFSVLSPERDGIAIRHHALDYDHRKAKAKMSLARVCGEYANALSSGLWPSLDILPARERRDAGVSLHLDQTVIWDVSAAVA